ncbi:MAG: exopolyphosphatase [Chloroflexaceae bacterium]|nr:exopolyphosphatase [Chloroflexaceae bacterium]
MSDQQAAIIDLGSNTTRMIVMAYQLRHHFRLTGEISETVRLAEGVRDDGVLQATPMHRALEALKMFHTLCQSSQIDHVIAVATSALREASNQASFLYALKREIGLDMRVLSGEEEAYYGYLGVINSLPMTDGFVIDIGGGSTEVTQVADRSFVQGISQQMGAVRLKERFVQSDPISAKELDTLERAVEEAFAELDWLHTGPRQTLVGLGGTIRALARIDHKRRNYPIERIHGYVLTRRSLENIVHTLAVSTQREREAIPGLNRDRADVILAGAVVLRQLMRQGKFAEIMISGQGLREGVFYEHFLRHEPRPLFADVRAFSVRNLAYQCQFDEAHANRVCELSLSLFDQLAALHGFGDWERELLSHAAILHDIGKHINFYDHHKHSEFLVVNSPLQGFTHREIALIALLTRLHRKGDISKREYQGVLQRSDVERVQKLGSLLRIAEYLERSKGQLVHSLQVQIQPDFVRIQIEATGDVSVEIWDANRRSELFRKAFDRDITIVWLPES